jgi:nucleoside-diphosphate-sugar epimerase
MLTDADNGLMRVIGNGENHWAMVYDRDVADLYVRLLASPGASGLFHATDESDETVRDIVEAIAAHAPGRPEIRYMPLAEARKKRGPLADALVLDQIVRSPRARALGWTPSLGTITRNIPRIFEEWRNARQEARD